jgi:hypothetical protein
MQTQGVLELPLKKRQGGSSMKLKQNNRLEFKENLVYANQKRWW